MAKIESHKISSLAAHNSKINCIKIGPKSGRVFVSGGQDRLVKLWTVGKRSCSQTLTGHVTPVESVALDSTELLAVAGSSGGSLKIWDIDTSQVVRTLSGHRSGISCLQYHPFGEFFASGSLDKLLKIWDIRRKGCIQTYSGHDSFITAIEMSPDGRWVAAGGDDGKVHLWDLTAGKLLKCWKQDSPVTNLSFNPMEFVIGSNYGNGTIKVHDLETFDEISSATNYQSKLSIFTHDGEQIVSASSDSVKTLFWEPFELRHEIKIQWEDIKCLKLLPDNDRGIAIGYTSNYINVWAFKTLNHKNGVVNDDNLELELKKEQPEIAKESTKPIELQFQESLELNFSFVPRANGSNPLNLNLSDFGLSQSQPMYLNNSDDINSDLSVRQVEFRHNTIDRILSNRLSNLRLIQQKQVRDALLHLKKANDLGSLVDYLKILVRHPKLLNLESAVELSAVVNELLFTIYEDYILIACQVLTLLAKSFGNLIESTLKAADPDSRQRNMAFEDREIQGIKTRVSEFVLCADGDAKQFQHGKNRKGYY